MVSDDGAIEFEVDVYVAMAIGSVPSATLIQGPGDVAAIGLGRGVMSCSGPKPGDE